MMDTWMAPRRGIAAAPMPVTAPGRAAPVAAETTAARAKLQPTVYQPTRPTDQRHAASIAA